MIAGKLECFVDLVWRFVIHNTARVSYLVNSPSSLVRRQTQFPVGTAAKAVINESIIAAELTWSTGCALTVVFVSGCGRSLPADTSLKVYCYVMFID